MRYLAVPDPTQIIGITTTGQSAVVSWNLIRYNGGYPLNNVQYILYYAAQNAANINMTCTNCTQIANATGTAVIANLQSNTIYNVSVATKNPAGTSFSTWKTMKTKGYQASCLTNFTALLV